MSEMFPDPDEIRYDAKSLRTKLTAAKEAIEQCYPATWSATMERMADEFELMARLLKEADCPNHCNDINEYLVAIKIEPGGDYAGYEMRPCQWCADAEPYRRRWWDLNATTVQDPR